MQSYASVFRRAAGGEANLVFRNIIRLINDSDKLEELESLLFDIIGPCKFKINFDGTRDLYVDVKVSFQSPYFDSSFVPIDLSGTGVIQITQILAYVILFKPKILLVDEPDSHLHPSRQALLSMAFERIVEHYGCKVVVSTHSRHLVSSASSRTKLVWLRNGKVEVQDDHGLVGILMDLGALDQIDSAGADIVLCTEDKGKKNIEACVAALETAVDIKVISYNGVNNAASAAVIKAMSELLAKTPSIIIHRDRDFLTEKEIELWGMEYRNRGMTIFCPKLPDIESYYVTAEHVATTYSTTKPDAADHLRGICEAITPEMRRKFKDKRRETNQKYCRDGGGPATDILWPPDDPMTPDTMLGKELVPRINEQFGPIYGGRKSLFEIPAAKLMEELRVFLNGEQIIVPKEVEAVE